MWSWGYDSTPWMVENLERCWSESWWCIGNYIWFWASICISIRWFSCSDWWIGRLWKPFEESWMPRSCNCIGGWSTCSPCLISWPKECIWLLARAVLPSNCFLNWSVLSSVYLCGGTRFPWQSNEFTNNIWAPFLSALSSLPLRKWAIVLLKGLGALTLIGLLSSYPLEFRMYWLGS